MAVVSDDMETTSRTVTSRPAGGPDEGRPPSVDLSGRINSEQFERAWCAVPLKIRTTQTLTVDMSRCTYIGPVVLAQLIALLSRAQTFGPLVVELPSEKRVRDHLRQCGFLQALSSALGSTSALDCIAPSSRKYLNEATSRKHPLGAIVPIQTYSKEDRPSDESIEEVLPSIDISRYLTKTLVRRLGDNGAMLSRRVFREAFLNAFSHPKARLVQAGSSQDGTAPKECYTFFVWDNGKSIPSTISAAIKKGHEFDQRPYESLHREIKVSILNGATSKPLNAYTTTSKEALTVESSNETLLLSAIYPGVTGYDQEYRRHESLRQFGGTGLFYLTNYVVDVLKGHVIIRSENLVMKLRSDEREQREMSDSLSPLSAEIRRYPPSTSKIQGNLIVVQIPLHDPGIRFL